MESPTPKRRNNFARAGFVLGLIFALAPLAHAASGTIDSTNKYAWSNVGGWVNFAPTHSTVTVTDSALTGYAWSENDGWINLAPAQGGVKNDGAGNLSGFAWDAGAGWVNFSGVKINSSGKFTGQATGGTVLGASYQINFDCTNCDVVTTWRPTTTTTTTTSSGSSGGGSISPVYIPPSSSQTGPAPSETGRPNPLPSSSPAAQNTLGGNSSPGTGSSGMGAVGAAGQTQTIYPPFPGNNSVGAPPPTSSKTSSHVVPLTATSSRSSIATLFHNTVVPVSIIAIALLFIFLIRFIL
ncbi:MAG: hypothetical protein ACYC6X_03035 [Minisyncoccota bacterium]